VSGYRSTDSFPRSEPLGEVDESKASLVRGDGIPHEKSLVEFGLSAEDFERLGHTPL